MGMARRTKQHNESEGFRGYQLDAQNQVWVLFHFSSSAFQMTEKVRP